MSMFLLGMLVMYLISFVLVMITDSCWEYADIILRIVYFPFYIITIIKRIIREIKRRYQQKKGKWLLWKNFLELKQKDTSLKWVI